MGKLFGPSDLFKSSVRIISYISLEVAALDRNLMINFNSVRSMCFKITEY